MAIISFHVSYGIDLMRVEYFTLFVLIGYFILTMLNTILNHSFELKVKII